jgi:Uncharacterized ACR, COG1993
LQRRLLAPATDLALHYRAELLAIGVAEVPEVVGMMDEVDELRRGAEDKPVDKLAISLGDRHYQRNIEIVDRPEEIDRLLPVLDQMIGGGLIVVEGVKVVRYLHELQPRSEA